MKVFAYLLIVSLTFGSCSYKRPKAPDRIAPINKARNPLKSDVQFDYKEIRLIGLQSGLPLSEFMESNSQFTFGKDVAIKYGIESYDSLFVAVSEEDTVFALWTGGLPYIKEIVVLSPDMTVNRNLAVGQTAASVIKKYPGTELEIEPNNPRFETACLMSAPICLSFESSADSLVGNYNNAEMDFSGLSRPETPISRINVDNN